MSDAALQSRPAQESLGNLTESLLNGVRKTGHPQHTLEIRHKAAPLIAPSFISNASPGFGLYLSFDRGNAPLPGQRVHCSTAELPFQDKVFSTVFLHHVVSDGKEAELTEAVRMLARDGVLILLGLNRMGWRFRCQRGESGLPGFSPLRVKHELDRLKMTIQVFAGAGLAGRNRPLWMSSGLSGLGLPVADVIMLQARRIDSPEVNSLRFRERRSGVVQSAPING